MGKTELAAEYIYDLYNVTDHVAKNAEAAMRAMRAGDAAEARRLLAEVLCSAEQMDMRYRDAVAKAAEVEEAQ